MALAATAARSTYHSACRAPLSQGLLQSYRSRQRARSPRRRSSRFSNRLSCPESIRSIAFPSSKDLWTPWTTSYTPTRPLAARQTASWRVLKTRKEGRRFLGGGNSGPKLMQYPYLRQLRLKSCSGTDTN